MTNQITPGPQSETSDGHCGQSVEVILLGCLFEIRLMCPNCLESFFLTYYHPSANTISLMKESSIHLKAKIEPGNGYFGRKAHPCPRTPRLSD